MNTFNSDFSKTINYKNNFFFLKKIIIIKKFKLACFLKCNYIKNKKNLDNVYYNVFREIESIFGFIPKIRKINLKNTNKKKKIKMRSFLKLSIITKKDTLFIFENYIVKYFYFYIKSLEFITFKKFNFMKEVLLKKINNKIKIKKDSLIFSTFFIKSFLNFSGKFYDSNKKNILKLKFERRKVDFEIKNIKFKISIFSSYIIFFCYLMQIIINNNLKINLFIRKKIRNNI